VTDTYVGILQSLNLPGGVANVADKYKIKLEIYDINEVQVIPGPGSFDFIVPTGLDADGVTVLSRKAEDSEIENGGFVFYLHVDNNPCEPEIYEASVNSVAVGPCGFISYAPGDDVHLSFKAKHTNGFARFEFTVVRGSSGYVANACAPLPSPRLIWVLCWRTRHWLQKPLSTASVTTRRASSARMWMRLQCVQVARKPPTVKNSTSPPPRQMAGGGYPGWMPPHCRKPLLWSQRQHETRKLTQFGRLRLPISQCFTQTSFCDFGNPKCYGEPMKCIMAEAKRAVPIILVGTA